MTPTEMNYGNEVLADAIQPRRCRLCQCVSIAPFILWLQIDVKISERYQQVMREWKACEVIVKQREKEMQSAIFAKLSSGSSIDSHVLRLVHRDSTLSNEVPKLTAGQHTIRGNDLPY